MLKSFTVVDANEMRLSGIHLNYGSVPIRSVVFIGKVIHDGTLEVPSKLVSIGCSRHQNNFGMRL